MMLPERFTYPSPGFSHYWNYGAGGKMLRKVDKIPTKGDIEDFAQLLWEYDKLADSVIEEVYFKLGHAKANELLDKALQHATPLVKECPECLSRLITEVENVPTWLDRELMETGARFCRRSGLFALVVLRNYCLMGGYESSAINKPLIYTEALKKGAAKRMAETIEFWVSVTGKDVMQQGDIGIKSAIKVRLMHAFARASILKSDSWDNNKWGIPINQCDMIATNLGFSIVFIEGLRRVGYNPTKQEVRGVLHLWKYIGYLLGIPAEQLPDEEEQAIEQLYKWTMFQSPADNDTRALADALKNEPLLSSYMKRKWQKKALVKIHLGYNNYFLGKRACAAMGLPWMYLRYLPYIARTINASKELLSRPGNVLNAHAEKKGRKSQEELKVSFLKGHAPALAQFRH